MGHVDRRDFFCSFGRRCTIIINVMSTLLLRLVITFCDSEGWFRLVLFLEALFGSANLYMGLVIICEIASNSWRSWLSMIVMSPRLLALVCVVPLANSMPNSETFNLIGCLCGVGYIIVLRWTPESPQWMLYNRKIKYAEHVLYRAALQNDITFSAEFKIRPVNQRAYNCLDETMTCLRIFSIHNVRVVVVVSLTFWSLFYFLWATLYMKIFSNGVGISMLLKIFGFLALLFCAFVFLSSRIILQRFLMISLMLTGNRVYEFLSSMALASGIMVHCLILNITPRFYAINVRATLFGCCHASGQLGAMTSYIIFIYKALDDISFATLELGIAIVLICLTFVLPQVDGRELPDMMEDMDYFSELSKPLRWATQKRNSPTNEEIEMRVYSYASAPTTSTLQGSTDEPLPLLIRPKPIGLKLWHRIVKCLRRRKDTPRQMNPAQQTLGNSYNPL
ncbi:solute carrier family 22 member 1-like [Pectinophora gossypiella]|uniref:solute carrier family 22 member 1-like n=1 Tax=Pectinophora gossypiella TaxID=13191 RepID=UPI00214EBDAE|nr:solute carrier family 22 member 1-like [Pectinophora gossypiella]